MYKKGLDLVLHKKKKKLVNYLNIAVYIKG